MSRAATKRRRARRAVALLVLALEFAAAAGLVVMVRGALAQRDTPRAAVPDADAVATHPRAFRGAHREVGGWVGERPQRRSARDRWAFILRGRGDGRLLVVAAPEHTRTVFREGARVIVHSRVMPVRKRGSRSAIAREPRCYRRSQRCDGRCRGDADLPCRLSEHRARSSRSAALTLVVDLQGRVLDLKPFIEEPFDPTADRVAIVVLADQDLGREGGQARRDLPDVEVSDIGHASLRTRWRLPSSAFPAHRRQPGCPGAQQSRGMIERRVAREWCP